MNEIFPVHETIETKQGYTIYKSEDWWKAVILYERGQKPRVGIYLWNRTGDGWTRKQKYAVDSVEDWERERDAVDSLIEELPHS